MRLSSYTHTIERLTETHRAGPPIFGVWAAALINQVLEIFRTERFAMTLFQHDFWSSITEGPRHGCEDLVLSIQHLCNTEIS
ncbi:hypothetical protein RRF57_000318 [Xylaria bambusicola]|uniref:Uncharacterized protein n=1 Tax=Xylaria bambusicola TaxID=326684 RepID=A0AAN7YZI3_9PEZI